MSGPPLSFFMTWLGSPVAAPTVLGDMMGTTHALSGIAGALAAAPLLYPSASPSGLITAAGVAAGFALLPDIDTDEATAARRFGPPGRLFASMIEAAVGHRTATHSLLAWLAVAVAAAVIAVSGNALAIGLLAGFGVFLAAPLLFGKVGGRRLGFLFGLASSVAAGWAAYTGLVSPVVVSSAAALGYVLHIVGDGLTYGGVPLLWPAKDRQALPLFRTNSGGETLFSIALLAVTVWLVLLRFSGAELGLPVSDLCSHVPEEISWVPPFCADGS